MPNITKPNDMNTVWASTGDIVAPDAEYIANGWEAIIPPREYFNWLDNRQDRFNAHVNQHGIPLWDSSTEYQASLSYAKGSDGKIYRAGTTNSNINPVGDITGAWFDMSGNGIAVLGNPGTLNWPIPPILTSGQKKAKVTVTGGGGSGGSGSGIQRGAGGGAGGTGISVVDLSGLTSIPVIIGAGGARRTTNNADGLAGGLSRFGTLITGAGGSPGNRFIANASVAGGFGGSATGANFNIRGGDGSDGPNDSSNTSTGGSGDGGASYWGGGARSSTSSIPNPGAAGSGGGGGITGSSPGGDGIIIIEW